MHEGASHDPQARRPADVYVPRWRRGAPACLDLAITSGLQTQYLRGVVADGADFVTLKYEDHKESFLDTRRACEDDGMSFLPLIIEAVGGGWGSIARRVWSQLAKSMALATGEKTSTAAVRFLQSFSIVLHKENARAILRRAPGMRHAQPAPANLQAEGADLQFQ